jgi:pyruvate dehydrogenase E2 component (dihydrolipoamide acetyltransferase)
MVVEWSAIEAVRSQLRRRRVGGERLPPTPFLLFAWCVAQAARTHPAFRSALINDSTRREYAHLHLGVAVARPGDDLVMARIENADALSLEGFIEAAREAIHGARRGIDQTSEAMQVSLTNLASSGVRFGIPVVAAPAVATIFLGAPYDEAYPQPEGGVGFRRLTHVVMTFDHRLVNGVGAARFLNDIRTHAEGLRDEFAHLFSSE